MMKNKWVVVLLSMFIMSIVLIGCQSDKEDEIKEDDTETNEKMDTEEEEEEEQEQEEQEGAEGTQGVYEGDPPVVTLTMENGGEILLELYPNIAPNSVDNFIELIEDGYYDGVIFHRVIPGFMIQGGDPEGTGMGGPGYTIKGEFKVNGFENDLSHERGVLSMARSQHPDSAGSQFFIVVEDSTFLDGEYASFGQVIEGMEVADEIVQVDRDGNDMPDEEQVIESMTVELNGYEPGEFEKITQ